MKLKLSVIKLISRTNRICSKPHSFFFIKFLLVMMPVCYANNNNLVLSEDIKKQIFSSPYRTSIRRVDGVIFDAILSAPNEHMKSEEYRFCNGIKKKIPLKTGNYYIYLYNASDDSFGPNRIEVFKNLKIRMNIKGAGFFTLYNADRNGSDFLIVSQSGCNGDYYEAYSFPGNEESLKQYTFVGKEKYERFHGTISKNKLVRKKVIVHINDENNKMKKMYLIFSHVPGVLQLQNAN